MDIQSQILNEIVKKTENGKKVPTINKNGVIVHKLTIFEDIVLRNKDNLDTIALEINGNRMTYLEFFVEVEKYIKSFTNLGIKQGEVVSLCMPVGIEFICAYFAITTIGGICNALNVMFLMKEGAYSYLDERKSKTLFCYDKYYQMLQSVNAFSNVDNQKIIITSDTTYAHINSDSNKIIIPGVPLINVETLDMNEFLMEAKTMKHDLQIAPYDELRASTFTYTSGTTGKSKCIAHSDLAPLFLVSSHDQIKRPDEIVGDRSLITIPLQHPTGLFYSMVLQMAQGKTLVLEPRYDKRLFFEDIKNLKINHAVQAKPFYAQLIQDRYDGKLKRGDFETFKHPYSGGEGFPKAVCKDVNDTLRFAGCPNDITIGYGRSEEGSITIGAYNIENRLNSVGRPIPGIYVKIVDPITKKDLPLVPGVVGEIQVSTPVEQLHNCYLGPYNSIGKPDGSYVDENGVRWSQPTDIATIKECSNGELSYLVLGRTSDSVKKEGKLIYLFEIKEKVSELPEVQECEVIGLKTGYSDFEYITVHIVLKEESKENKKKVIEQIYKIESNVDAIKFHEIFGINLTSGKCDKDALSEETTGYFTFSNGEIQEVSFENEIQKIKIKK